MLNRKAKPTLKIPNHCPKCGALLLPDYSWEFGHMANGWKCLMCGLTSESGGFYSATEKNTVKVNEQGPKRPIDKHLRGAYQWHY